MRNLEHNHGVWASSRQKADIALLSMGLSAKAERIALLDGNTFYLNRYASRLRKSGFSNVVTTTTVDAMSGGAFEETKVMAIDLSCAADFNSFFAFLELARFRGYAGHLVFMSDALTCDDLYRCAILGACDFWIKSPHLQLEIEVARLLNRKPKIHKEQLCPESVANLGLFRTVGLSTKEIELICALAHGFPRQCEIASRLGKSSSYVHKMFSRIYEKLNLALAIDNPTQLAHLITVCSLFK